MLAGMQLNEVLRPALDFQGVLDDHVALAGSRERDHLVDQRARQRGLARAGPAANRNVLPAAGGVTEYLSLDLADYSIAHVIIERIEHLGRLAHRQAGTPRHRRQQSFEADAFDGQLTLDDRMLSIGHRSERGSGGADQAFHLAGRQRKARLEESLAVRLEPYPAVVVHQNVSDAGVGDRGENARAELAAQKLVQPPFLDLLRGDHCTYPPSSSSISSRVMRRRRW